MRQVADNREEARAVGREAALWIRANLSVEAIGSRMKQRLLVLERTGRAQSLNPGASASLPRRFDVAGDKVLILTPVKDAEPYLPRYFELLDQVDYDRTKLSIGLLESDSRDRTMQLIEDWAAGSQRQYHRITITRQDYGFRIKGPRWAPEIQRRRREILARSRNRLLANALRDEDWVLWLDVDLVDYPADLIQRLLAAQREIVVPHCVSPNGRTFDLNTFVIDPRVAGIEDRKHLRDGLLQPPRGDRRIYLDAFESRDIVAVDAVGGTALLVRADLHREGLIFPPFSYRGYIETEGLAMMAADMGVRAYGLPGVRITHSA
jgi:glycosyltransferase involved in cell wall biosynthesis